MTSATTRRLLLEERQDPAGNKDEGAGDQGIMFGYACTETEALTPAPILLAFDPAPDFRVAPGQGPDRRRPAAGRQEQVTLKYIDGKPVGATSVVVSTQQTKV